MTEPPELLYDDPTLLPAIIKLAMTALGRPAPQPESRQQGDALPWSTEITVEQSPERAECRYVAQSGIRLSVDLQIHQAESLAQRLRAVSPQSAPPTPSPATGLVERTPTSLEVKCDEYMAAHENKGLLVEQLMIGFAREICADLQAQFKAHIDTLAAENERLKARFERLADAAHELYRAALGEDTGVLGAPSWSVAAAKLYLVLEEKNVQA